MAGKFRNTLTVSHNHHHKPDRALQNYPVGKHFLKYL